MKKKHDEEPENAERWLLTYADLITLLMVFFTVLFAMASVDASKFKVLAQSLNMAFNSSKGGGQNIITNFQGQNVSPPQNTITIRENQQFSKVVKLIKDYASKQGMSASINTSITERGLVVNLADSILYESGKADLSLRAKEILDSLADIIFKTNNSIRVEGHTDNVPIQTQQYQSNWQLSTDRATNVIMYWIINHPEVAPRLSATGYGEYRPKDSNSTPEGQALNRRVEIVLLREEVARKEY